MPAYRFEAAQADGTLRRGVLEADTAKQARSQLREQQLVPLQVDLAGDDEPQAATTWRLGGKRTPMSANELAIWTRQLAGLVSAGLPLERALSALLEEAEDERVRDLVGQVRAEVNAGASFGKALAQHPHQFPVVYQSVVAAGEQSGALGMVLNRLADEQESSQNLKAKLLGASLYPAIVTLIAIVIVTFLVTYVVPQVAGVFAGTKKALPVLTTVMLWVAGAVRQWGWLMLLTAVAAGFGLRWAWTHEPSATRLDQAWLRAPVVGQLARGYNSARFASTLAMLVSAGVPILKALQSAADTMNNRAMRQDVAEALVLVREGAPLAGALQASKRFPSILPMFTRLGEQTGQLPVMLERAALQLSQEVQRRALQLATVLEPLLIVAMGGMVMLIVLAVLLPIIQLNTLVK